MNSPTTMVAIIIPLLILSLLNLNNTKNKAKLANNDIVSTGTNICPFTKILKYSFMSIPSGLVLKKTIIANTKARTIPIITPKINSCFTLIQISVLNVE